MEKKLSSHTRCESFSQSGALRAKGFSNIELLVIVVIFAILLALLFPAARSALQNQKTAKCLANLRSYGIAVLTYSTENQGLPWWNRKGGAAGGADGSTLPNFEKWLREGGYLHSDVAKRLRCPLAPARVLEPGKEGFEYSGNAMLCNAWPKLIGLPMPLSRVVLAAENYNYRNFSSFVHLDMTMDGWDNNPDNAQYHRTSAGKGLIFFMLDGHVETLAPAGNGGWRPSANEFPGGPYYYSVGQF